MDAVCDPASAGIDIRGRALDDVISADVLLRSARQLVVYAFALRPLPEDGDLARYMAVDFANAMRECFKGARYAAERDKLESHGSKFLVGVAGRLFSVGGDYSALEDTRPYAAVGSGEDFAIGVLFPTAGHNIGGRVPFHTFRLEAGS